jgi:hypothetical protein
MKLPIIIRIAATRTCAARHLRESIEIGFDETAAELSWRSEQSTRVPRLITVIRRVFDHW